MAKFVNPDQAVFQEQSDLGLLICECILPEVTTNCCLLGKSKYSKISLFRPLNLKTTPLLKAAFASPQWPLPYNFVFSNKATSLIGPVFGSPEGGLNNGILLQILCF